MIDIHDKFINGKFTMDNALSYKKKQRRRLAELSIDEKIKIVENLREQVKPIRDLKAVQISH